MLVRVARGLGYSAALPCTEPRRLALPCSRTDCWSWFLGLWFHLLGEGQWYAGLGKEQLYRFQHTAEEHEILPYLLRFYLRGWLGFRFIVPRGVDAEGKFTARFGRPEEVGEYESPDFPLYWKNRLGGFVEESLIRGQVGCPPPRPAPPSHNSCRVILGSLMEELLNAFSAGS